MWLAAAVAALVLAGVANADANDKTPTIQATPVAFHQTNLEKQEHGRLKYVGGYALSARAKWFGGWSGFAMTPDGRKARFVSDKGYLMDLSLAPDRRGVPTQFKITGHNPLRVLRGKPRPYDEMNFDAEEIIDLSPRRDLTGPFVVSFERHDRIARYKSKFDQPLVKFRPPIDLRFNRGFEAAGRLADGRYVFLTEYTLNKAGGGVGWVVSPDFKEARTIAYKVDGGFRPTGLYQLPDGNMLVLERAFNRHMGVSMQLRLFPLGALRDGYLDGPVLVRLGGGYTIDNFESLSVRETADGRLLVYLLSDNNFSRKQQTLFMVYELDYGSPGKKARGKFWKRLRKQFQGQPNARPKG